MKRKKFKFVLELDDGEYTSHLIIVGYKLKEIDSNTVKVDGVLIEYQDTLVNIKTESIINAKSNKT